MIEDVDQIIRNTVLCIMANAIYSGKRFLKQIYICFFPKTLECLKAFPQMFYCQVRLHQMHLSDMIMVI